MHRYKIRVTGTVQGVAFRATARYVASRLGLTGFAHNQPDGSVYIEIEGKQAALTKFVAWCHEGPSGATVSEVTLDTHDETKGYEDFTIG